MTLVKVIGLLMLYIMIPGLLATIFFLIAIQVRADHSTLPALAGGFMGMVLLTNIKSLCTYKG